MPDSSLQFVTSYPESGGLWAGYLISSYLREEDDDPRSRPLASDADAWAYHQATPVAPRSLGFPAQVQTRHAAMLGITVADRPRVVTSHHAAVVQNGLSLFSTIYTDKVAIVVRDPRDVTVSLAERLDAPVSEAAEKMADRAQVVLHESHLAHAISSWSTHVATWLKYDAAPTRFFRYEDLIADTKGELTQLLGFLGVEETVDHDRVRRAVETTSLDRLQREHAEAHAEEAIQDHQRVCRRGGVGIWHEELSEETVVELEREHGKLMRAAGYEPLLATDLSQAETVPAGTGPDIQLGGETAEGLDDTGLGAQTATEEPAAPAG